MSVTFTTGPIEVWRDGALISRHRSEREAVESILAHAETAADGEYEIRNPVVKVNVKRRIFGPDAPALGTVITVSSTELTVPLDRPASGPTRIESYELERSISGEAYSLIASGLAIFGAGNAFPDTGLLPSTNYSYRCRAKDTTQRYSEYSYSLGITNAASGPAVPINFTATATSESSISLAWAAGPTGATPDDYDLDYSTVSASGPWTSIPFSGTATTYSHTGLSVSTRYWYRVRAGLSGAGSSSYATVDATTSAAGEAVLLTEDFSSATWYTQWHSPDRVKAATPPFNCTSEAQGGRITRVPSTYTDQGFVPRTMGGSALKVTILQGTNNGSILSFYPYFPAGNPNTGGAANALSTFATDMTLEYYLRFGSTWFHQQNGKLPGFRSCKRADAKDSADGAGNSGCDGLNGWSARGKVTEPCDATNWSNASVNQRIGINSYVYHADLAGVSGDSPSGGWGTYSTSCGTSALERNRWYKIKYRCKCNTGTNADGILQGWVDDVKVMEKTNYRFDLTTNKDHPLGRVWMDVYHGGGLTAPQDIHLFITDVRVWVT